MYNIAICDDEVIFSKMLSLTIKNILDEAQIPFNVDIYSSGNDLLNAIDNRTDIYNLLLLDILMDGMDGMELAKILREKGNAATIVFVSSTPDFSLKGYEVGAFRYLLKPTNPEELKDILYHNYENSIRQKLLTIKDGNKFKQFYIDKISHFEIQGRKVAVFSVDKTTSISSKLPIIAKQLPSNKFIRCHQSFIINLDKVVELRYGEAIIDDGKKIPISRTHWKEMQTAFLNKLGDS